MKTPSKIPDRISNSSFWIAAVGLGQMLAWVLMWRWLGKDFWGAGPIISALALGVLAAFAGMALATYRLFPLASRAVHMVFHRSLLRKADALRKRFESDDLSSYALVQRLLSYEPEETGVLIDCMLVSGLPSRCLAPALEKAGRQDLVKRMEDQSPLKMSGTLAVIGTLAAGWVAFAVLPAVRQEFFEDPAKLETQIKILVWLAVALSVGAVGTRLAERKDA